MSYINVFHHNQSKRQDKMKKMIINFFLRTQSTSTELFPVLEKNCYRPTTKIFKKIIWNGLKKSKKTLAKLLWLF